MIKAIIFDLWNTLAVKEINISSILVDDFGIKENEEFLVKYEQTIQLEKWKSIEQMIIHCLDSFGIESSISNVDFISNKLKKSIRNAALVNGSYELLSELKSNYKLALLSNTNTFEVLNEKWNIPPFFDAIAYSYETGFLKPKKKSFENVCKRLGVKLNECIFVDDLKKNVDAALRCGMNGILFKDITSLREHLIKLT